jgi:choline dehydrogenase-like flavoprotein
MTGSHYYIPWWLWDSHSKLGFPRGYHVEFGGGFGMPQVGSFHGALNRPGAYGKKLKQQIRREYGATIGFSGRGEAIPRPDNYCELDPGTVDQWGIPVLRFHYKWGDEEIRQARHMRQTFTQIIETMGGRVADQAATSPEISVPGTILHEVGTVRMGRDPRTSALNQYCQAHEVSNLFVADAAPFVSNPDKNPTHTIIALAWRSAEYLAEEMRKGNL